MKKFLFIILLIPLFYKAQDSLYTRKVLNTLCSKELAGRGYVNNGLEKAVKFISSELKKNKIDFFYQPFEMNVNTFPGKMEVKINGKELTPGIDFIAAPYSLGLKKHCSLFIKKDSVSFISNEIPFLLSCKRKLTFSVADGYKEYSEIELLDTSNRFKEIKTAEVNIENKFITNFPCKNIIASINGTEKSDSIIMFTAHYDHLGMMGSKTFFPGANDNASGVSMLLNLIKYYKQYPSKHKMLFVFFAGEEAGLLGSKYFTEHPTVELTKIKFLINLDLLGTGDEGITVVNATEFKPQFELLKKINEEKNYLPLIKPRGKAHNSDHYYFTEKGVPSFFIYTMGGIKAYHDVYDKPETLPLTKYKEVFHLLIDFVGQIN